MLLNVARCDYLTLTTFEEHDWQLNLADLYPLEFGKDVKKGGYSGKEWDGLFFGYGSQKGRKHYLLTTFGEDAETILHRTSSSTARCTRIDLQVTIRIPEYFDSRNLYDKLQAKDTKWNGRRLKPTLRQSGGGLDTVYIGSRTSQRFVRIYVKPDKNDQPAYLRYEVEFKGKLADQVRRLIVSRETFARNILHGELNRLPIYVSRTLGRIRETLHGERYTVKPETVYIEGSTIAWLQDSVSPAVVRLLHSHQDGIVMRKLLRQWVQYALDLNGYTDMDFNLDDFL
jgi:hypothetical protein